MNSAYQHHSSPPPIHYREPPSAPPPLSGPPSNQYPVSHVPNQNYGETNPSFPPLAPGTQPAAPEPSSQSRVENGRRYELRVIQQPKRARMCGFGDKDRRPITPPPCVRLIITDAVTGKEIDCNEIDHSMFVLNVDLWSPDGTREVNLVKHSNTSPSISSTTPVSYQHMSDSSANYPNSMPPRDVKPEAQAYPTSNYSPYVSAPPVSPYGQPAQHPSYPPSNQYNSAYPPANGSQPYAPQNGGYGQAQPPAGPPVYYGAGIHAQGHAQPAGYQPNDMSALGPGRPLTNNPPTGMYTRNLIGSLSASAFRLTDPDNRIGIWFVLQDLSVRTEGNFRLRFSFVNVGLPTSPPSDPHHNQHPPNSIAQINKGKAPVLAACFSEPFLVYSAKRFPGVVESTELSKCFAHQGIKIPIRKDGTGKGGRGDDDDYD